MKRFFLRSIGVLCVVFVILFLFGLNSALPKSDHTYSVRYESIVVPPSEGSIFAGGNNEKNGIAVFSQADVRFEFKGKTNEPNLYVGYLRNGVIYPPQAPDAVRRIPFQRSYRYQTEFTLLEDGVYQFYIYNVTADAFEVIDCTVFY